MASLWVRWRAALLDAWALLMPVECAGCGAQDRGLCADCREELIPIPTPRTTSGGLGVVTALRYEAQVRRVILAFKEHHRTDLALVLAEALESAIRYAVPDDSVEFAPVPSSRAAYRRRGYDPVFILLRRAGITPSRVLRQVRRTVRQKSLDSAGRAENVRGAFRASVHLTGRRFLLIDDVLTTGATLDDAARAIRAAGGEVIGAATVAFTPRLLAVRDKLSG
ncbi:MAG: ComF family protein [Rhodoglobus sp.]